MLAGLALRPSRVRRTSSRFCLGVEHGDYNGCELFGVGTDRFIHLAYRPAGDGHVRLLSANFEDQGAVRFAVGEEPPPLSAELRDDWARFPCGAVHVLRREGYPIRRGLDGVLTSDIPGGGMSRSASLTVNLILTLLEVNGVEPPEPLDIARLAQAVENDYIGSPCGLLDPMMILFARAGMGTHYVPATQTVRHVPLGDGAPPLSLVAMDTGTVRPGLEKSTYRLRRRECEQLVTLAGAEFGFASLGEVDDHGYRAILERYGNSHPDLCARLTYIHGARRRFGQMLDAWRSGDLETVGAVFRADGRSLRDDYVISGPELETMCDIARTVPGVLGERMLGGGDKGAAGAVVRRGAVPALRDAVARVYPSSHPGLSHAVHELSLVDGVSACDWPVCHTAL